jgi:hypothetical protein
VPGTTKQQGSVEFPQATIVDGFVQVLSKCKQKLNHEIADLQLRLDQAAALGHGVSDFLGGLDCMRCMLKSSSFEVLLLVGLVLHDVFAHLRIRAR